MQKAGEEVFLQYKGRVHYDTIGNLIGKLKEKMFEAQIKQSVYKKVLMVMIEALENVFKYHEYFENEKQILLQYPPNLIIKKSQAFFKIESSNPVRKVDVPSLKLRLETISKMDKSGVKDAYKETITNGQFSEKGGAGLGIIEMAKISDEIIDFKFEPINDDFDFYSLTLIIYCN